MAGRFEGLSDLEWKLFEDIFPGETRKTWQRNASCSVSLHIKPTFRSLAVTSS